MPIRHGSSLAKNDATWARLSCFLNAVLPRSSTPCIWIRFFAKSTPTVVTFIADAPLDQVVNPQFPLWHIDAVSSGGVHSITTTRARGAAPDSPAQPVSA